MTRAIESFRFTDRGVNFCVDVISYDENCIFDDEWEMTDEHKGGVTVKNPNERQSSYKYAIPRQYSLAERVRDLLNKGVPADKASAMAYEEARAALSRDLSACDYGYEVTAEIGGVNLLTAENVGCSFNYSYEDDCDLLTAAQDAFTENGVKDEAIRQARINAQKQIDAVAVLNTFVNSFEGE
ncbi:hypothetical protein SLP22_0072 [Salmonella phage BAU.Micro_SLP-22]|nr:hypothetical protein SLP22_00008 [Salmonella phage BAU.Micro_SLP-22]